jgi:hypothetical protein
MSAPKTVSPAKPTNTAALVGVIVALVAVIVFGLGTAVSSILKNLDIQIVVEGIFLPIIAIIGIVLSSIGLKRAGRLGSRGMATLGLVVNGIVLVIVLVVIGAALVLVTASS